MATQQSIMASHADLSGMFQKTIPEFPKGALVEHQRDRLYSVSTNSRYVPRPRLGRNCHVAGKCIMAKNCRVGRKSLRSLGPWGPGFG